MGQATDRGFGFTLEIADTDELIDMPEHEAVELLMKKLKQGKQHRLRQRRDSQVSSLPALSEPPLERRPGEIDFTDPEAVKTLVTAQQAELRALAASRAAHRREKMTAVFEAFDLRATGEPDAPMSLEQFRLVGQALHHGEWSDLQNAALHQAMDQNSNGEVELEEFLAFYQGVIHDSSDAEFQRGLAHFEAAVVLEQLLGHAKDEVAVLQRRYGTAMG
jgi:hypothetical protein